MACSRLVNKIKPSLHLLKTAAIEPKALKVPFTSRGVAKGHLKGTFTFKTAT